MKLTPLDIHQKEFRRVLRGYSEEEVDAFLDEVATEFERVFQENIDIKEEAERLKKKLAQYEKFEETLQDTMLAAQRSAEEIQNNARKAAELVIKDAELKAKEIVQNSIAERQAINSEIVALKKLIAEFKEKMKAFLQNYLINLDELEKQVENLPEMKMEEDLIGEEGKEGEEEKEEKEVEVAIEDAGSEEAAELESEPAKPQAEEVKEEPIASSEKALEEELSPFENDLSSGSEPDLYDNYPEEVE